MRREESAIFHIDALKHNPPYKFMRKRKKLNVDSGAVLKLAKSIDYTNDNLFKLKITLIAPALACVVFMCRIIKHYENKSNDVADQFSLRKAERLDDIGDEDGLLEYCLRFISKYPNDANVTFYLGLAYCRKKILYKSKIYFSQSVELNPNMEQTISAYLDSIEEQLFILPRTVEN